MRSLYVPKIFLFVVFHTVFFLIQKMSHKSSLECFTMALPCCKCGILHQVSEQVRNTLNVLLSVPVGVRMVRDKLSQLIAMDELQI